MYIHIHIVSYTIVIDILCCMYVCMYIYIYTYIYISTFRPCHLSQISLNLAIQGFCNLRMWPWMLWMVKREGENMDCAECGRAGFSWIFKMRFDFRLSGLSFVWACRKRDSAVPTGGSICQIRHIKKKMQRFGTTWQFGGFPK